MLVELIAQVVGLRNFLLRLLVDVWVLTSASIYLYTGCHERPGQCRRITR